MQIAGTKCFVCEKHIGTVQEAVGCALCEVFAHGPCAVGTACLVKGSQLHALPGKQNPAYRATLAKPAGVTVLALLLAAGGLLSAAATVFVPNFPLWLMTVFIIQAVILLVCGIGFFKGLNWARLTYLWTAPAMILVGGLIPEIPGLETSTAERWILPSVGYGIIWVYLTRPRTAAFFASTYDATEQRTSVDSPVSETRGPA